MIDPHAGMRSHQRRGLDQNQLDHTQGGLEIRQDVRQRTDAARERAETALTRVDEAREGAVAAVARASALES